MPLSALANEGKLIARFPGWQRSGPERVALWFNADLEIGGVVEAGFTLHGEARIDLPDQNVGLELVYQIPGSKRRFSIARLDWRSIKGGHSNNRRPEGMGLKRRVGPTHFHRFELNYVASAGRMRAGDLPYAEEIAAELQGFESARFYAGKLLGISNIDLVTPPPWEYVLALNGGRHA